MSVYDGPKTNNMTTSVNAPVKEKSLGDLFGDLTRDTSLLVRQEVQLAKAEVTATAVKAGKDVGMIAGGALFAYAGLLLLLLALTYGLVAAGMSHGVAAALVGVLVLAISGLMIWQGIAGLKRLSLVPQQTMETLKEDKEWLQGKR